MRCKFDDIVLYLCGGSLTETTAIEKFIKKELNIHTVQKNKIDNSEVETMSRIDKTQIMKQCFELILSGNIKKTYSNGIISNPYKPISEFKRRRHNI